MQTGTGRRGRQLVLKVKDLKGQTYYDADPFNRCVEQQVSLPRVFHEGRVFHVGGFGINRCDSANVQDTPEPH